MVPESLIFFRVPVSSAAKTGVLIRAAAMAAPRMTNDAHQIFLDIVFYGAVGGSFVQRMPELLGVGTAGIRQV
jgi:hypothetical protein